jgi:hypothetical protein
MTNAELRKQLAHIKNLLDDVWGLTDDLLFHLFGEDGPSEEHEDVYGQVVHAYEEYITRGSRCIDGAYWLVVKEDE